MRTGRRRSTSRSVAVAAAAGKDEVTMNLERAKEVLEKAKRKLSAKGANGASSAMLVVERGAAREEPEVDSSTLSPLPFFASREVPGPVNKRERVIKTVDESTGLITTDGEKMARLSEEEEWEVRTLLEVFENEISDRDVYSEVSQQLASRDVAASVWNLRKTLQTEDYKKIFDEKNRFIGEGS
jgi:hypothetical protein